MESPLKHRVRQKDRAKTLERTTLGFKIWEPAKKDGFPLVSLQSQPQKVSPKSAPKKRDPYKILVPLVFRQTHPNMGPEQFGDKST